MEYICVILQWSSLELRIFLFINEPRLVRNFGSQAVHLPLPAAMLAKLVREICQETLLAGADLERIIGDGREVVFAGRHNAVRRRNGVGLVRRRKFDAWELDGRKELGA